MVENVSEGLIFEKENGQRLRLGCEMELCEFSMALVETISEGNECGRIETGLRADLRPK